MPLTRRAFRDGQPPGTPNRVRLKSSNFPDRYVRHADRTARVDPLGAGSPAVDRQDATFRVTA